MIALVADHKEEITALCKKHGIVRLELFGSAATGKFNPKTSDLDFIVDIGDYDSTALRRFLGFADDLETLFARRVDVITERQIQNPYFRRSVDRSRETVYEGTNSEEAA